ncbi:MAG: pilin [Candidatus Giovannonibacteria bacterium]|nr:pilin [Candidatus Giovannonibacteria bacterium]
MKKFLIFNLLFLAFPAFAADGLVTCGLGKGEYCTPCDLWTLAKNIVDFLVKPLTGLAFPVLVLALLIGGIVWATSAGNPNRIETGKKVITSSIVGIFIAFGGWLIVDTIINTLVSGSPTFAWQKIQDCKKPIDTPITPIIPPITEKPPAGDVFQTDEEARQLLLNNGVPINKGDCPTQQATTCTSLKGLPKYVATKLIQLQTECWNVCPFVVTGGTEAGHQTHGPGQPVVDIVPAQNNKSQGAFLVLLAKVSSSSFGGVARCESQGGAPVNNCKSPTNHIHVSFPLK